MTRRNACAPVASGGQARSDSGDDSADSNTEVLSRKRQQAPCMHSVARTSCACLTVALSPASTNCRCCGCWHRPNARSTHSSSAGGHPFPCPPPVDTQRVEVTESFGRQSVSQKREAILRATGHRRGSQNLRALICSVRFSVCEDRLGNIALESAFGSPKPSQNQ